MASDFIDRGLTRVFDALRLDEGGGGSLLRTIWNFVVTIAERVVKAIVRAFTERVLSLIAKVAATVGIVSSIVSAIRPWSVSVTSVPPMTVKGVGGLPGQAGQMVVRVDLGGYDEWPPYVEDCAPGGRPASSEPAARRRTRRVAAPGAGPG